MTNATEWHTKACEAYFNNEFEESAILFSKVIEEDPSKPDVLLKRCAAYQNSNDYAKALGDAERALAIIEKSTSEEHRSLLAKAHLNTGVCLHHLGHYTQAQEHFEQSRKEEPENNTILNWFKRNSNKIPIGPVPIAPTTTTTTTTTTPKEVRARHEWFQSEQWVTLQVLMKNIQPGTVQLEFYPRALSLCIKMSSGSDYNLELDPLSYAIDPSQSTYKVLSTKLEIRLKKQEQGILWKHLEGEDTLTTSMTQAAPPPTATHKTAKDWNKLAKTIEEEQEKPEGEKALNAMFQQIYSNATDDAKRAMMKSFVESNGTCLSTNWSEVGSQVVETKPPEGMIAKKYEG
ncbi:SGS domain-containing protein [Spinellus fusiger]|nr:SGS domain-containing protein [Spinellus fusiger]